MTDIVKQLKTIEQISIAIQRLEMISSALFLAYDLCRSGCPYTNEELIREHIEEIGSETLRLKTLKQEALMEIGCYWDGLVISQVTPTTGGNDERTQA